MQRDRTLLSTWNTAVEVLDECLSNGQAQRGLPLVAWLRADARGAKASGQFYSYAAATYARCGQIDQAVALAREALRVGYGALWHFSPAWHDWRFDAEAGHWVDSRGLDPHANDSHGIYRIHRYLQPLHDNADIKAILAQRQSEPGPSYGHPSRLAPLCWLEATELGRKSARCEASGKPLAKGDSVYAFRYFNGAADIPSTPLVADPAAFDADPWTGPNGARYREDGYPLEGFALGRAHHNPFVNEILFEPAAFDLDAALGHLSAPPQSPTPYYLVAADGTYTTANERRVGHGDNRELVDLLWMLVKSGHLEPLLRRLPELPRHFGLLLTLFDRPALRAHVAQTLGMPRLPELYALFNQPRLGPAEIAALARLGRDEPELRRLLAESLRTYEYHLYSNYCCAPNWFFQDFHYFTRARAGHFLYVLATEPDLLEPLARMLETKQLATGGASAADIEYANMKPFFYGTVLLHQALRGSIDLAFWSRLPETGRRLDDLAKVRTAVLKAARLV